MPQFTYPRTIHFSDTDAAGVVFFARYLFIAHEAYEEALAAEDIDLAQFFSDNGVIIPIAKSEASYLRPLQCGEKIEVELTASRLSDDSFALDYVLWKTKPTRKRAAVLRTEHTCIDSASRKRSSLPGALADWVDRPATA
jgi:1,4-dihydroxy-2-naphthoyl-CoA hydrolase